jgi:hypothetical protein
MHYPLLSYCPFTVSHDRNRINVYEFAAKVQKGRHLEAVQRFQAAYTANVRESAGASVEFLSWR